MDNYVLADRIKSAHAHLIDPGTPAWVAGSIVHSDPECPTTVFDPPAPTTLGDLTVGWVSGCKVCPVPGPHPLDLAIEGNAHAAYGWLGRVAVDKPDSTEWNPIRLYEWASAELGAAQVIAHHVGPFQDAFDRAVYDLTDTVATLAARGVDRRWRWSRAAWSVSHWQSRDTGLRPGETFRDLGLEVDLVNAAEEFWSWFRTLDTQGASLHQNKPCPVPFDTLDAIVDAVEQLGTAWYRIQGDFHVTAMAGITDVTPAGNGYIGRGRPYLNGDWRERTSNDRSPTWLCHDEGFTAADVAAAVDAWNGHDDLAELVAAVRAA